MELFTFPSVIFCCRGLANATGESEVVFVSMDHICGSDGLSFEICIHEEKALKENFQQRVRCGLDNEALNLIMEIKICVVKDHGFLIREVGSRINRFYLKQTSILEEDNEDDEEEQDVKKEMKGSDNSDYAKKKKEGWQK
ncbi:hypothetical protein MA16_Dca021552 [Dendrobium catenatum]|uniref:Uncharacterized protein n=1 Tax=Dendrobium catenatum TaxID=906689 RepID=A0A2I0VTZ0_9ASPA|nr:hypothetical protein MA16_Dca021552 [Dendrobium catenatum]